VSILVIKTSLLFWKLTFFSTHMDRHEGTYKCHGPECDKIEGFTDSGSLLRHQRDVHKKETAWKPLICPHTDCYSSNGLGFFRLEILKAHLRRYHMPADGNVESLDLMAEQVKREAEAREPTSETEPEHEED
jgi:hypothetical protein